MLRSHTGSSRSHLYREDQAPPTLHTEITSGAPAVNPGGENDYAHPEERAAEPATNNIDAYNTTQNTGTINGAENDSGSGRSQLAANNPTYDNEQGAQDLPPAPGTGDKSNTFQLSADTEWQGIKGDLNKGLQEQYKGIDFDTSRMGRRMANINAMSGGSVGGAFVGGQMQAGLEGAQMKRHALNDHQNRSLKIKMTYLDILLKQAEAQNDREMRLQIENAMRETELKIATMEQGSTAAELEAQSNIAEDNRKAAQADEWF